MGRRSDHTRPELRKMIVAEGHRHITEVGFARFSAREVAKRIGYSIGTLYNVFGSYDQLILAINGKTLDLWLHDLEAHLEGRAAGRLRAAIDAYFDFALSHHNAWAALYEFRLSDQEVMPEDYQGKVTAITEVVVREIRGELAKEHADRAAPLARSLLATVHGHCYFALNGTFALLGERHPLEAALERVEDAVAPWR